MYRREWAPPLLIALLLALVTACLFSSHPIDLAVQRLMYRQGAVDGGWYLKRVPPWLWLRAIGPVPGIVVAAGALAYLLLSAFRRGQWRYRVHCTFLVLTMVLGPGLVVNTVLKMHWGRPRPCQIEEFGGHAPYRSVFSAGVPGAHRSFPCGHSSAGYYLAVFYFLLRRHRPRAARWTLAGALLYGTLIGISRMCSGSHFLDDVLWSGLLVFLAAHGVYYFILNVPAREDGVAQAAWILGRRRVWVAAVVVLGLLTAFGVSMSTPVHRHSVFEFDLALAPTPASLTIRGDNCVVDFFPAHENRIRVDYEGRGFGLPGNRFTGGFLRTEPGAAHIEFQSGAKGWFSEKEVILKISFPPEQISRVEIRGKASNANTHGFVKAVPIDVIEEPAGAKPPRDGRDGMRMTGREPSSSPL